MSGKPKVTAVKDQLPRHKQVKAVKDEVSKWVHDRYGNDQSWLYYDCWFNSENYDGVRSLRFRVRGSQMLANQDFADEMVAKVKEVLANHGISESSWYVYTFNPVGSAGRLRNNNLKVFYQSSR